MIKQHEEAEIEPEAAQEAQQQIPEEQTPA